MASVITSGNRFKDGENFPEAVRVQSFEEALERLLKFELGFGGTADIDGDKVIVTTRVMSCLDTTVFEFTDIRDRDAFFRVVGCWALGVDQCLTRISTAAFDRFSGDGLTVSHLLAVHAGPILIGSKLAKLACILAFDLDPRWLPAFPETSSSLGVTTAAAMLHSGEYTPEQIQDLVDQVVTPLSVAPCVTVNVNAPQQLSAR